LGLRLCISGEWRRKEWRRGEWIERLDTNMIVTCRAPIMKVQFFPSPLSSRLHSCAEDTPLCSQSPRPVHTQELFRKFPSTSDSMLIVIQWCLVLAGISDFYRPAEKLSLTQNVALTCTGLIWTRWCLIIKPRNIMYFPLPLLLPNPSSLTPTPSIREIQRGKG
jgi:hypothetical protein